MVTALKNAEAHGGTLIQEGYTHQYSKVANPYDGVSGDDAEFYSAQCATTPNPPYTFDAPCQNSDWVIWRGPLPGDSESWALGRVQAGQALFTAAGLTPPAGARLLATVRSPPIGNMQWESAKPSVVTVGVFQGGVRHNIIPDEVKLEGTIRAFDEGQRDEIHAHVKRISEMIAQAGGATAKVHIHRWYDVTVNDPALTEWAVPTLDRIAGEGDVRVIDKVCGAEDFSFYQKEVPGFFYFMGCTPPDRDHRTAAPNHSPRFFVDENCLKLGVKTLSALALDWLSANVA